MKKTKISSRAMSRKAARSITVVQRQKRAAAASAINRLSKASARLWQTLDLHDGLKAILTATIELLRADLGTVQLFDAGKRVLHMAAHRGFKRKFLEHFREVSMADKAACGRALRTRRRVIIEDVEKDAAYAPHLEIARSAGYRAVQATPIIARDGRLLGMISTHFRTPRRLEALDLQSLDLYVRQASDFIERCGVEQELRDSRCSLQAIFDSLCAQIAVVDAKGEILMVNEPWRRSARRNAGVPAQVNEGANYFSVCEQAAERGCGEAGEFLKGMRAVLSGRTREYCFEYPCQSPEEERWFMARVTRFTGCGAPRVVVAHEDITARKNSEAVLRASEEKYRWLFENMSEAFQILEPIFDKSGKAIDFRYLEVNPATERLMGRKRKEIEGRTSKQLFGVIEEQRLQVLGRVLRSGRPAHVENHSRDLDAYYDVRAWKLDGRRVAVVLSEVTQRRRAEEALRDREARLQLATSAANVGLWDWDLGANTVYYSPGWKRLIGYRDEEISNNLDEWQGRLHPDDLQPALEKLRKFLRHPGKPHEAEYRFRHKNGSYLWIYTRAAVLRDAAGKVVRMLGCHIDITARKNAETALQESEDRYRLLAEHTEDFVALSDVEGHVLYLSPSYERRLGVSIPALRARGALRHIHPDDAEVIRRAREANLAGEATSIEYRFRNHKGEWLWLDGHCTPVRGARGEVTRLLLVSRDITARKRVETALRESEERYRQLIQSLPVAVYTCDAEGRIILFNAEAVKLWGRKPDARKRWDASFQTYDVEGRRLPRSQLAIVQAVREGDPMRGFERIIERHDGSRSHVLSFADPIRDGAPSVRGGVNVLVDITALKNAEAALRASMRRLQTLSQAVEQSPASVIITTPEGEIEYVNRKFTEVTGYAAAEVLGKHPRFLKSGEHTHGFYKDMWATITAGHEWRGEFCNRKKDGSLFWEYAVIAPVVGEDGRMRNLVAIKEDVTERRQAIAQLRIREERLRAILNTVLDAVITIDRNGIITDVNPATERMFGYKETEMLGQNVKMLMPSPYREEHDGYIQTYHRTGHAKIIGIGREIQAQRKDGTVFPVELAVGEVDHMHVFTGVIRDITERRRLEMEILNISESERIAIGQDLHDDLGQQLAGTWLLCDAMKAGLVKEGSAEVENASKITGLLKNALAMTRSLARGMQPVAVQEGGLAAALHELADRTGDTLGISCQFTCPQAVDLDNTIATHLYRIAQEAVTNAVKHTDTKTIDIELSVNRDQIVLSVKDNGTGPGKDAGVSGLRPRQKGNGMQIMRYRADIIGGSIDIHRNGSGVGTTVICSVPIIHPSTPTASSHGQEINPPAV